MSLLALPPGVEPLPDPEEVPVPQGIQDSMQLLMIGLQTGALAMMRKNMDDSASDVIYDLAVGVPNQWDPGAMRWFPIARMLPQHPKEAANNEPSVTTVPASDPIN
jgi:hypothetical protein